MVKEFQQFYRDSTDGDETQSVHIIIENVLTELGSLMESHRVDFSLVFVDHTSLMYIDRGKLLLVLKNIIVNGIESMAKKGGTLNISTDLDRGYLKVMIEDDGVGIKKEQQELIFEPFFTTKPDVQGAGLGLSVAYGTMKSLGGTITFSSEEGQGAVFIVHIPLN